ncbi:ACT domain-containing protein ACR12 isoform X2 [Canna indica]|uniref:ACT domain-containing protein ACR n=1 Tax=Canna indica TaxID=4628 RepID=A0AAQ3Q647_9LILI|nr:ACT domain-containing protein ACR12 isoform X2 [Canna indica]
MALAGYHFLSSRSFPFSAPALRRRSRVLAHHESLRPQSHRPEITKEDASLHGSVTSDAGPFLRELHGSEDDFPSNNSSVTFGSASEEDDLLPTPILLIDQDSDPDATIVWLSFGDRLGALLDTTQSLRNLGLDVTKGTVTTEDSIVKTNFLITLQGRKVDNPDMLEKIRLTIINNLLEYHPESSQRLAMGEVFGIIPPKKLDVDVNTLVLLQDDGPNKSLLYIETIDRPGLLLEIIKIVTDISIDVKSAEINTEGLVAKDKFHVGYKGAALPISLSQVKLNTILPLTCMFVNSCEVLDYHK